MSKSPTRKSKPRVSAEGPGEPKPTRARKASVKPRRSRSQRPPSSTPPSAGNPPSSGRGGARRSEEGRAALRVFLVLLVAVGAAYSLLVFGYGAFPCPGAGREVELEWPAGLSADAAAARLAAAGVVTNPWLFSVYLRLTGRAGEFRPGHHLLTDDMAPAAITRRMQVSGAARGHVKVVLHEGMNRFDMAKRLQSARICGTKAFLGASADPSLLSELGVAGSSAEGYLFPATYELTLDSEPRDVIARMKGEFDKRFDKLWREHPAGAQTLKDTLNWGPRDALVLASVIQKEAMMDDERPIIASVFLNRMRDASFVPHRLQSDPTAGYGCLVSPELFSCRNYTGRITGEMNADEANAYSTYRHDGLPPGPISNPGEKSLAAVLEPAETRYFYFVARGEGRHAFSETYAQHNEAIRKARAASAEAAGRAASNATP